MIYHEEEQNPVGQSIDGSYKQAGYPPRETFMDANGYVWQARYNANRQTMSAHDAFEKMANEPGGLRDGLGLTEDIVNPFEAAPPDALPPFEEFVKQATGNFCGIRLPGWGLKKDTLFDPAVLCSSNAALRLAGIQAHQQRGHTTVVVQPAFDYPGFPSFDYWQNLSQYVDILGELRDARFKLIQFCTQSQEDAKVRFGNGDIARLAEATREDVSAVCAGWEFEPSCPPQAWLAWAKTLKQAFPKTYRFTHWTPERVGPEALPGYWDWEGGFWQYVHKEDLVRALFLQTPHGSQIVSGNGWHERVTECVERIQDGGHNWGGQWLGDVWVFEAIAYDFTNNPSIPESRGVEIGQQAKALRAAASLNA